MSLRHSAEQVAELRSAYQRDGMVSLGQLLDPDEARVVKHNATRYECAVVPLIPPELRERIVKYESDGVTLRSCYALHQVDGYWRDLAHSPRLVDLVRSVAGIEPELYSLELRKKAPRSNSVVGIHQESAYWLPDTRPRAHIWLALDDVLPDSGPVRFWLGYRGGLMPHETSAHGHSCDEKTATELSDSIFTSVVPAGHATMHNGIVPHDSLPNTSDRERMGVFFGYVAR